MENLIIKADEIANELKGAMGKAKFLSDMMFEEFFSSDELETQEDINNAILGYKNAAIAHDIMTDYLKEMQDKIKTLTNIIDKIPAGSQERDDRK